LPVPGPPVISVTPGLGGPDRLVLVALDGGDDVAHPAAPGAGQRRHECAVADDHQVGRRLGDHEVVLDADDAGAPARSTRRRSTPRGSTGVAR
jgi:hypothetical protein